MLSDDEIFQAVLLHNVADPPRIILKRFACLSYRLVRATLKEPQNFVEELSFLATAETLGNTWKRKLRSLSPPLLKRFIFGSLTRKAGSPLHSASCYSGLISVKGVDKKFSSRFRMARIWGLDLRRACSARWPTVLYSSPITALHAGIEELSV